MGFGATFGATRPDVTWRGGAARPSPRATAGAASLAGCVPLRPTVGHYSQGVGSGEPPQKRRTHRIARPQESPQLFGAARMVGP